MNEMIREFRENIIFHYMEGDTWDLRINPNWIFEGRKYSPEEELILTMYVKEEMPFLELYEQNGETKFRKISEIPEKDQLIYFRSGYLHLRDEHYSFYSKIQKALEGF